MSERNVALRFAAWLITRLAGGTNSEAVVGDIQERFHGGKSVFWLAKEVSAAIAAAALSMASARRGAAMKRSIVMVFVMVGVFALGFYAARSPYIVHEEMPSTEVMERLLNHRLRAHLRSELFRDILSNKLAKARADYAKAPSPERKAQVDSLQAELAPSRSEEKR